MVTLTQSASAHVLFGKARLAVLRALFVDPGKAVHLREMSRMGAIAPAALSRELRALLAASVITETRRGNQRVFQANTESPLYEPLRAIAQAVDVSALPSVPQPKMLPRKSERLGLSAPYDWSNSALDDEVLIAKTLAAQRFDDVAKICLTYGVARVRAVMEGQIQEALPQLILRRQLENIESALQG